MPLIGIIGKKKDLREIKVSFRKKNVEIVQISKDSISNIKNIKFDQIIFLEDLKVSKEFYEFMKEIISSAKYIILNGDIEISIIKEIEIQKPIKVITFGFNLKSTITISSVKEEKIIVCLQREIEKVNGEIIEIQEKEIRLDEKNKTKIYNKLVVFIIKELHNL